MADITMYEQYHVITVFRNHFHFKIAKKQSIDDVLSTIETKNGGENKMIKNY